MVRNGWYLEHLLAFELEDLNLFSNLALVSLHILFVAVDGDACKKSDEKAAKDAEEGGQDGYFEVILIYKLFLIIIRRSGVLLSLKMMSPRKIFLSVYYRFLSGLD